MQRQDYIERLIAQIAEAIARALGLARDGRQVEAQTELDAAWSGALGLSRGDVQVPAARSRSSIVVRRAACCGHDGDGDEVVGARAGMEGERTDGEGVRGGSRFQGVDAGVLGQLPTDGDRRCPSRQEA